MRVSFGPAASGCVALVGDTTLSERRALAPCHRRPRPHTSGQEGARASSRTTFWIRAKTTRGRARTPRARPQLDHSSSSTFYL